jgi:antitoxin (DNA-binding transcriptional repressor) of toxin-antitoxin stability system
MATVGVREFKRNTSSILKRVREDGESFTVACRGKVIARLEPVTHPEVEEVPLDEFLAEWDALIELVSENWPEGFSAVEAVREQRRDL